MDDSGQYVLKESLFDSGALPCSSQIVPITILSVSYVHNTSPHCVTKRTHSDASIWIEKRWIQKTGRHLK